MNIENSLSHSPFKFRVEWNTPDTTTIQDGYKLFTHPLPGSGSILTFILNILKGYEIKENSLTIHRIIESFKYGYAKRTELGDKNFVPGIEEVCMKCLVKNLN